MPDETHLSWFAFYPGDYLRDTSRLSPTQHGCYILLLLDYYSTGGPLPLDEEELFRIARAVSPGDRQATGQVIARFFTKKEDGYYSARADKEIRARIKRAESLSFAGKKGNQKRWENIARRSHGDQPPDQPGDRKTTTTTTEPKDTSKPFVASEILTRPGDGLASPLLPIVPPPPPKKAKPKPTPDFTYFVTWWHWAYKEVTGSAYCFGGKKDGALVKRLLSAIGLRATLNRATQFLLSSDPWVAEHRDLGCFSMRVNQYDGDIERLEGAEGWIAPARGGKWGPTAWAPWEIAPASDGRVPS